MKKSALLLCLALASTCGVGRALDLTPKLTQRMLNGIETTGLLFLDGTTKYSVTIPVDTTVSGEKGQAHFYFSTLNGATFVMTPSPQTAGVPFEGPGLEAYRKSALSMVPKGATDPVIQKEIPNAMPQSGWVAYRVIVASQIPGMHILQEITFWNFSPAEQVVLVTTSVDKMFKLAEAKSLQIMGSWRLLNPGDDVFTAPPS